MLGAGMLLMGWPAFLHAAESLNYKLQETVAGSLGTTRSAAGKVLRDSGGEAVVGQGYSANYSIQAGFFHEYYFSAPTPTVTPTTIVPVTTTLKVFHSQINPTLGESATVRWTQSAAGRVSVTVYNLAGERIATLVKNQTLGAGQFHQAEWNGTNSRGTAVGSGIYIVHLKGPDFEARGKIAVIK